MAPTQLTETPREPHFGRTRRLGAATGVCMILITGALASSDAPNAVGASSDNGVSTKTPGQIVAAAQAAIRNAKSYVVNAKIPDGSSQIRIQLITTGAKRFRLKISKSGETAEIIILPDSAYITGNAVFWKSQRAPDAAKMANHWIEVPLSATKSLTAGVATFSPNLLSRCLGEDLGTLSKAGTTTVGGAPAVLVHDAGNNPGDSPGYMAVATSGPAYPLSITSTGPTLAGGRIDACNDGRGSPGNGTVTISDFDHVPAITAPIKTTTRLGTTPSSSAAAISGAAS